MGWFKRLVTWASEPPSDPNLTTVELIQGKLSVRIVAHDIVNEKDVVPCWTYCTIGLLGAGQKELVLSLVRPPGRIAANPPEDFLVVFREIYAQAEKGNIVDAGDRSVFDFREGTFLGRSGRITMIYTPLRTIGDVETPSYDSALTMLLVAPEESDFVERFGHYRLLARLGRSSQYYPHPPWSDINREPMIFDQDLNKSFVGTTPGLYVSGAYIDLPLSPTRCAGKPGDHVQLNTSGASFVLHLEQHHADMLGSSLPDPSECPEGAFFLAFEASPAAEARATWMPDDDADFHHMIASKDTFVQSLTAGFLFIGYGEKVAANGCVREDSFGVTMSTDTYMTLYASLKEGKPISLPPAGPGNIGLTVKFGQRTCH